MTPPYLHGSALVVGDRGLLVVGPSGSGKTTLCLALLDHCRNAGVFARVVSDDQLFLSSAGGRLIARTPETIAGLIEVRGYKPSRLETEMAAVVDFLVRLVPPDDAPRYAEAGTEVLEGCSIPCLRLPAGEAAQCVTAVNAWLELPPFSRL